MKKRIVIIGAGASGLAAAIEAARTGADVIVLEHTGEIGKKLLMTGNGRCNYTNTDMSPAHFHSHSDRKGTFVQTVLSAFGWEDTVQFFRELGINPRIRHYEYDEGGYVYPASGEARAVLKALLSEAAFLNVRFFCGCRVYSVAHMKDQDGRPLFQLDTNQGMVRADSVIMAAGAFVQGSSIELSADAPIKEPYIVYVQGALTFEHACIAVRETLQRVIPD